MFPGAWISVYVPPDMTATLARAVLMRALATANWNGPQDSFYDHWKEIDTSTHPQAHV